LKVHELDSVKDYWLFGGDNVHESIEKT